MSKAMCELELSEGAEKQKAKCQNMYDIWTMQKYEYIN